MLSSARLAPPRQRKLANPRNTPARMARSPAGTVPGNKPWRGALSETLLRDATARIIALRGRLAIAGDLGMRGGGDAPNAEAGC